MVIIFLRKTPVNVLVAQNAGTCRKQMDWKSSSLYNLILLSFQVFETIHLSLESVFYGYDKL